MTRDPEKLEMFRKSDRLVVRIYKETRNFPQEERFGLQAQMRRAAVSVPTNLVEGCARLSTKDYLNFVNIALSSACEVRYLVGLSSRLELLAPGDGDLADEYDHVCRGLNSLLSSLRKQIAEEDAERSSRTPAARKPPQAASRKPFSQLPQAASRKPEP